VYFDCCFVNAAIINKQTNKTKCRTSAENGHLRVVQYLISLKTEFPEINHKGNKIIATRLARGLCFVYFIYLFFLWFFFS
jgi:hypothetical protein